MSRIPDSGIKGVYKNHASEKAAAWADDHREHRRLYMKKRREDNPAEEARRLRNWRLKHYYGLTEESFNKLLASQGGRCAMPDCRTDKPRGRGWHVDHDHETGRVRAILCTRCNILLGLFESMLKRADVFRQYISKGRN